MTNMKKHSDELSGNKGWVDRQTKKKKKKNKPKFYDGPFTPYKAIVHDSGLLELSSIKFRGKWLKDAALCWDPLKTKGPMEIWDNTTYIIKLYKQLKSKRKGDKVKVFKKMCKKYDLDFE